MSNSKQSIRNWLKYNFQIFETWFIYILLRKRLSNEVVELMDGYYNFTPRERKLFERIKRKTIKTRR